MGNAGAERVHTPTSAPASFHLDNPFLIRRPGPTVAATTSAPAAQIRAAGTAHRSLAMPQGLIRVFESSKVWTALGALAIVIASVIGLDPAKATKVVGAVTACAITMIAATGYEDGQEKGAVSASPQVTINPSPIPSNQQPATSNVASGVAKVLLLLLLPSLLFSAGCQSVVPPAQSYTDADNATYAAVAPEYAAYVARDPSLSAAQIARRENTLATWSLRLQSAGETPATLPSTQP
jgi:hypothetical protein